MTVNSTHIPKILRHGLGLRIVILVGILLLICTYYSLSSISENATQSIALSAEEDVAICLAVKDQGMDLREFFIHHYYHVGIRRFYVMDDGSNPALESYALPNDWGIPRNAITFYRVTKTKTEIPWLQLWIYDACNEYFGAQHKWMAFIDADEFIEVKTGEILSVFLKEFEHEGGLGVNWEVHTSNGKLEHPVEGNRKAFTECVSDDENNGGAASENRHIKSIINTAFYKFCRGPHSFSTINGTKVVGENHDEIGFGSPFRTPITRNRISVHHYALKSKAQYMEKSSRGSAMSNSRGQEYWDQIEGSSKVICDSLAREDP